MSHRQPEVIDLETSPRTASLVPTGYAIKSGPGVTLEWVATATADAPAVLRATVTNTNEFRAEFRTSSLPPFDRVSYSRLRAGEPTDDGGLYLAPTEDHPLVDGAPGYERRADGNWYATDVPPKQPGSLWLDSDESVAGEYYLLGPTDGAALVPGRYRFGNPPEGFVISVWDSDAPGPTDESALAGTDLPALPDADAMMWYHDADATTEVYLRPSAERTVIPGRLDFEFVNRSRDAVEGNPMEWHLYKLADGEWFHVAPSVTVQPLTWLFPGDANSDALRVFRGDPVPCDDGHDVGYLGGGRYAFAVGMGEDTTHAVAFDLLGDPVAVTPTDGTEVVERDGDSLVATAARGDPDDERSRLARYTVERVDVPPAGVEPRRLVAEQVIRCDQLRDALGLLDEYDARTVTLTEYDATRPPFGVCEPRFAEYDGATYRIETGTDE